MILKWAYLMPDTHGGSGAGGMSAEMADAAQQAVRRRQQTVDRRNGGRGGGRGGVRRGERGGGRGGGRLRHGHGRGAASATDASQRLQSIQALNQAREARLRNEQAFGARTPAADTDLAISSHLDASQEDSDDDDEFPEQPALRLPGERGGSSSSQRLPPLPPLADPSMSESEDDADLGLGGDFSDGADDAEHYAAERYPILERISFYLRGDKISNKNRPFVEACLVFEAGVYVLSLGQLSAEDKNSQMFNRYKELVESIEDDKLEGNIRSTMLERTYQAKTTLQGSSLITKFNEIRSDLRNHYVPKMPANLSSLPSGKDLKSAYEKLIGERWKTLNPELEDETLENAIEHMNTHDPIWWQTVSEKSWKKENRVRYILCLKVHRNSKEISRDCTSEAPGVTRTTQRQMAGARNAVARATAVKEAQQGDALYQAEKRLRVEVVRQAIDQRQTEQIEKQLELYSKYKDSYILSIGEESYHKKVTELLAMLKPPSPLDFGGLTGLSTSSEDSEA